MLIAPAAHLRDVSGAGEDEREWSERLGEVPERDLVASVTNRLLRHLAVAVVVRRPNVLTNIQWRLWCWRKAEWTHLENWFASTQSTHHERCVVSKR